MSSLFAKQEATIVLTPSADHSAKSGYLATFSGEVATLSASATVPATLLILDGQPTTGKDTCVLVATLDSPVWLKATGTIAKGARVQQSTDGSVVTDATTGARVLVGVAMEAAVSGDRFMAATHAPVIYAA